MPRPTKIWLITDTHFYDNQMIKLCGRPQDFTNIIMGNLRHFCAQQDILIHLGDCIFYRFPELKGMLDSIPCSKFLLVGNHDRKPRNWYMRNGFDAAMDQMVWGNVVFSHKPVKTLPDDVEYNIHGHFHNSGHRASESWYNPTVHRKLAVEETEYKPIELRIFLPEANI